MRLDTSSRFSGEVVTTDPGFNGHSETVQIIPTSMITPAEAGSVSIVVTAYVLFATKVLKEFWAKGEEAPTPVSHTADGPLVVADNGTMTLGGSTTTAVERTNTFDDLMTLTVASD